jgi:hypothetical protein
MSRRRQTWADDSSKRIELSEGASVTVAFHGNHFDLTPAERKLVADLTDVIRAYREAEGLKMLNKEAMA